MDCDQRRTICLLKIWIKGLWLFRCSFSLRTEIGDLRPILAFNSIRFSNSSVEAIHDRWSWGCHDDLIYNVLITTSFSVVKLQEPRLCALLNDAPLVLSCATCVIICSSVFYVVERVHKLGQEWVVASWQIFSHGMRSAGRVHLSSTRKQWLQCAIHGVKKLCNIWGWGIAKHKRILSMTDHNGVA